MNKYTHFPMRSTCLLFLSLSIAVLSSASFLQADSKHLNFNPYAAFNHEPVLIVDRTGFAGDHFSDDLLVEAMHPKPPKNIVLEASSAKTLKKIQPDNAMVGVVDINTGIAYLNPVTRRYHETNVWNAKEFGVDGELLGHTVEPIEHLREGITAHKQLAERVDKLLDRPLDFENYIGFGITYNDPLFGHCLNLQDRSRSLNGRKFVDWKGGSFKYPFGNVDAAFEKYQRQVANGEFDELPKGALSAPRLSDITQPNLNGLSNYKWKNKIHRAIDRALPNDLVDKLMPSDRRFYEVL